MAQKSALEDAIQDARALDPRLSKSLVLAPWKAISDSWIKKVVGGIATAWKEVASPAMDALPAPHLYLYRDELRSALQVSPTIIAELLKVGLLSRSKRKGNLSWTYQSPDWIAAMSHAHGKSASGDIYPGELHLDIHAAAAMLNTYPEAVRRAVKAGAIPFVQNKNIGVLMTRENIEKFREDNIFVGDLANSLGAANTTLRARLKAVGILPFSGTGIDGGLVSIYKRSDLDQDKIEQCLKLKSYPNMAGRKTTVASGDKRKILSSTEASALLSIPMQRLQHFQKFGLLTPVTRMHLGTDFRRYFTAESVARTKAWIDGSVTLEDAVLETKVSSQALIRRFVNTGFINIVKIGRLAFLSREDLSKIKENLELYCSCDQADKYLNAPNGHTSNLISTHRVKIVPASKTGIDTIRLLLWSDVKNLLK